MKKSVIIGIAGGSCSGKTSIAKRLYKTFLETNSVVIIRQDDYYKDQSNLTIQEREKTNYDHPLAFDTDLLISDLEKLINGETINKPVYDFVNHTRSSVSEEIAPCDVIILEGLFALENEEIRSKMDIKLYVKTAADLRFIRRLKRDVVERGRTMESIIEQYITTVRVMHDLFIHPTQRYADVIIPEGGKNEVAIDLLTTKISSIIKKNMI